MAGVEAGPPSPVKSSLYRRLRLALALWRARRATTDGRFPRRTDRAVGLVEAALGYAGREDRVTLLEGIAALHAESARRGGGAAEGARAVAALRRALSDAGPDEALILAQLAESQATLSAMTDDTGLLREAVATARRAADRAPDDPLTRIMPDLDLTFAEIAARRGGWGRLGYLSACETTYTPRTLADEAIHLTSAFLLVGFSGVIGTLWRVPDAVAETTARVFYDALDTTRDEPAVAPARTARLVRVHYGDAPAAWSAHHHVGI